jgi:phage-related protein
VLSTLARRGGAICYQRNLHGELDLLQRTFHENSDSTKEINRVKQSSSTAREDFTSLTFLLFLHNTFNHISTTLSEHNLKMAGAPAENISDFVRPLKDNLGLKVPAVYMCNTPRESGKDYT